nr:cell division protein ZapE [Natronospira proteinivora]
MARWESDLAAGFVRDEAQEKAIHALEAVYQALVNHQLPLWERFRARMGLPPRQREPVEGLYLWGGVGRGKTHLMDLFYESLPFRDKRRQHFHRFMREAHRGLKRHGDRQDPLEAVADDVARETRVLCFDEFFVSDVADAMILATLLDALFRRGVCLVATSNIPPQDLYRGGLQRQRFLPAIEALERHTRVMNVDGGVDYRLRVLEKAEIYHAPLDEAADTIMADTFQRLAPDGYQGNLSITVEGREIPARGEGDGVAWFDFETLCEGPRSQNDYIELAHEYHTILLSRIPVLKRESENAARRFIALVDEFYDRNVKLIISAQVPAESLYQGRKLEFEFQRTLSRLEEIQTREYLALPHLP